MSRNIERASRAIKVYICMLIQFFSMDCTCIPLKICFLDKYILFFLF